MKLNEEIQKMYKIEVTGEIAGCKAAFLVA
jgi:hypothetical protein